MPQNIFSLLDSNFFQTLAVGIGALITWGVYCNNKLDNIKNAAALLKLEMDSIEEAVVKLKSCKSFEDVFQSTPIYQKLDWFTYRGILVSKLDLKHIESINQFYTTVVSLEEARAAYKNAVLINRKAKTEAVQNNISQLLLDNTRVVAKPYNGLSSLIFVPINQEFQNHLSANINQRLNVFQNMYLSNSRDFIPSEIIIYFETAKQNYNNISNTPAYEQLRKLSNKKRGE